jgi:hypothetical protein
MIAIPEMFRATAVPGRPIPASERRARSAVLRARREITLAELVQLVNRELAARGDCAGLEVYAGPVREIGPDVDGCNWNPAGLRVRIGKGATTRALGGLRQVVDWARLNFDLMDDA